MAQFHLPDVGEGLTEAEIVSWKVQPGDEVSVNDVLVEIETAKSLVELPSPYAGTVAALLADEGSVVAVGTAIVDVDTAHTADADDPQQDAPGGTDVRRAVLVGYGPRPPRRRRSARAPAEPTQALHGAFSTGHDVGLPVAPPPEPHTVSLPGSRPGSAPDSSAPPKLPGEGPFHDDDAGEPSGDRAARPLAKPPVRRLARDLGIALDQVTASGPGATITRADVEAYALATNARTAAPEGPAPDSVADPAAGPAAGDTRLGWAGLPRTERVPVRSVRRATAKAVVESAFSAPHVTQFVTVDVSASMDLLERMRDDPAFADVRVSPLTLTARAVAAAARHTPQITAAWDAATDEIVLRRYVDLGIATATPRGLLVPVVRDADRLSTPDLARAIADVAARARDGRTTPQETSGGTLSITNIGVFGMDTGTPIIAPGQSAILALGQVSRRPWVVPRGSDEVLEPRWVTTLALSFDHRLIDGQQAASFLSEVAESLSDPAMAWARL